MMDMEKLKQLYGELQAINDGAYSLGESDMPALQTVQRFYSIVNLIAQETGNPDLNSYSVRIRELQPGGRQIANRGDFKQNVYTFTRIMHENYLKDNSLPPQRPQVSESSIPIHQTFQQQQSNNQTNEISVEFNQTLITLSEILTQKEQEYESDAPEKGFIEKLKSKLATVRSTIDVVKLILVIAAEFGLTMAQLSAIFR